jgi:hypothetical protein
LTEIFKLKQEATIQEAKYTGNSEIRKERRRMFEGNALPIDFKMACYLRDQSKKTLDEMSTKPDVCTNGVRTRIQVFQDMASCLCPGHSWIKVDDTNRICEVCGGKEDGESLDNWLQETYTRGCHNCDNCNIDSDLMNDIQSGEKMSRLSEYAVCRAEEYSSPDEEAETKLLAFMQGVENCPHWIGRN